jgi:predicted phage terminase large subunit-like protein
MAVALSAVPQKLRSVPLSTGNNASVSTTTQSQGKSEVCSATTATYSSSEETQLVLSRPLCDTDDFTTETIVSIEPAGRAEVFDIEVARTHNFIANDIVSSNTRWHDDDLSGRIEANFLEFRKEEERLRAEIDEVKFSGGQFSEKFAELVRESKELRDSNDRWEIIKYPAIATSPEYLVASTRKIIQSDEEPKSGWKKLRDKGEPLHPVRFHLPMLQKIRKTLQPRHWSALYQQNPIPDEGLFFTKDMVRYEPLIPDFREMYTFAAWDIAVGLKNMNDFTVGVVGALDYMDNIHIIDIIRGRMNTHQTAEAILDTAQRYKCMLTGIEKGPLELAMRPQLEKRMQERRFYPPFAEGNLALKPVTDKIARARPLQGRMQQGKVIFPANQPWVETAMHELLRFPGGVHDDIVDALAWLIRMVSQHAPPAEPRTNRGTGIHESWRTRIAGFLGEGQKTWMSS